MRFSRRLLLQLAAGTFFGVAAACAWPYDASAAPLTVVFPYRGAETTWTVPAGITSVSVQAWGAAGGLSTVIVGGWAQYWISGGGGGYASGVLKVTPGQKLTIIVGQGGRVYNRNVGSLRTFGGGGNQGVYGIIYSGRAEDFYMGSGGGRSAVRIGGTEVITAGGGGGGGAYGSLVKMDAGGGGGGSSGRGTKRGALGGTQTTAGQYGGKYTGGNGWAPPWGSGGGGGGWYGGGSTPGSGGGGAGGSAHCDTGYISGCRLIGSINNTSGGKNEDNYKSGIGYSNICRSTDYYGNCTKWELNANPAESQGNGLVAITYDPCPTPLPAAFSNGTDGFKLPSNAAVAYHLASNGYDFCINNAGAYSYFIPANTAAEIKSFINRIPYLDRVTVVN